MAWITAIAAGVTVLARHSGTPGKAAAADVRLLPVVTAPVPAEGMNLLMFVHPQCPCTRAAIEELSVLMSRCGRRVHATVFVFQPHGRPVGWCHTGTWDNAAAIPGVTVLADPDAVMARKYRAQTSGQVLLLDRSGRLRFAGGITAGRGESGDNDGLDTAVKIITGEQNPAAAVTGVPVFGCPIWSDDDVGEAPTSFEIAPTTRPAGQGWAGRRFCFNR